MGSSQANLLDKLKDLLGDALNHESVRRTAFSPTLEELAEDTRVASISVDKNILKQIHKIEGAEPKLAEKAYFIDGAVRTVYAGYSISCNGIDVPLFLSQIAVGAIKREGRELRPFKHRSILVLMAPSHALAERGCHRITFDDKKALNYELNYKGDFYKKIMVSKNDVFFTDISVKLQSTGNQLSLSIKHDELVGIGKIRRRARDRAKVIMRIMELMLAYKISKEDSDQEALIVMDGPIGLLLPYSRLTGVVNLDLDLGSGYASWYQSELFGMLSRVVGVVKNVVRVPSGLRLDDGVSFYMFPGVSGLVDPEEENIDEDDLRSYILAGYLRLRPGLLREIPVVWSPSSALVRVDVPLPAIMEPDKKDNWLSFLRDQTKQATLDQVVSDYIYSSEYAKQRLKDIVSYILGEAMPIPPSSSPHRVLVEIYPIYEVEAWVKSKLLPPEELSSLLSLLTR